MHRKHINAAVSMAVSAVMGGLLITNLNALTAAASYGTPKSNSASQASTTVAASGNVASTSLKLAKPGEAATPDVDVPQPTSKLDLWLEELAWKESNHQEKIRVLDWNGRYSYGCLQFQMGTFKAYMTKYQLVVPNTPQATWEAMIYNCDVQKSLAKLMIKDNYLNWKHWSYTVHNKVGLPPIEPAPAIAVVK